MIFYKLWAHVSIFLLILSLISVSFSNNFLYSYLNKSNDYSSETDSPLQFTSNKSIMSGISSNNDKGVAIAFAGDFGCNGNATNTLKQIKEKEPDLFIALGDLSYKSSGDCWFTHTRQLNNKTRVLFGNHEVSEEEASPSLIKEYKKHYGISDYYSFNFRNIHVLLMNSEISFGPNSTQYKFVKRDLESASSNDTIDWIIVSFHRPIYTSPSKHDANVTLRDIYHPLFDKNEVDIVIQAHNHNYQRTYPILFNKTNSDNPTITSKGKNNYTNPDGKIFLIVGTGGQSLSKLKDMSSFVATQFKDHGFVILDFKPNGEKVIGFFHDNKPGLAKDTFSIQK